MSALSRLAELKGGALYDGWSNPITIGAPAWSGSAGLVHALPACEIMRDPDIEFGGTVDLIYALPVIGDLHAHSVHFREVLTALERGEVVALHGDCFETIGIFRGILESVSGGQGNA